MLSFSHASEFNRVDLIVESNTHVALAQLTPAITIEKNKLPTYFLSYLHLKKNAHVYLDRDARIDAKNMILEPGSVVHTLGLFNIYKDR